MSFEVAGSRAKAEGPLKLAVPRGALFGETLDVLDAAGIDTAELRGDSRSLIFETEGLTLVTMRPSDVPTYVEAGAADVGITGKDVLLEQSDRAVYELLDLGYGRCRMVLAGRKGDERLGEAQRRLGMMRIATKYPRIADRAGAADRPRRRHRRPGRDRAHAGGERPRGARGDRRVHGALRRQPGRPQAARRRGRRADREAEGGERRMRTRRFEWEGAAKTAAGIRAWAAESAPAVDVGPIERAVREGGDAAVLELSNRFDATEQPLGSLWVDPDAAATALDELDPALREALEVAAANIRAVAEAQLSEPRRVTLPQGQSVTLREVPVGAAGVYAPGGRAAYPSSVLMCAIPARVAGVERVALASPAGADGRLHPLVLAAAALCGVGEIYAIGGAQAIFALAHGTETIAPVDVIAGPGNAWVREAKRAVYGTVGIDSLAGPSELMVVAGHDTDPEWAALDLCSQAEHGPDSPLVAVAVEEHVLDALAAAIESAAAARPGVEEAPLALVRVPDLSDAIDLANAFAPEHLELMEEDAALLADRVTTAGCVFAGRYAATAFGDYAAGSNHVLPTGGAGRFSGPLGPAAFRRRISTVEVPVEAAAALAPQVDALARAEGFPVHGESAMIRSKS
jgi:histidinol dehydrogenase